jgi:hypothetical protein
MTLRLEASIGATGKLMTAELLVVPISFLLDFPLCAPGIGNVDHDQLSCAAFWNSIDPS